MSEIKKPANHVISRNSDYYTKPRKVTDPKIAEIARQLNFKGSLNYTSSNSTISKDKQTKTVQQSKAPKPKATVKSKTTIPKPVKKIPSTTRKKEEKRKTEYDGYDKFERDYECRELKEYKLKLVIATIAYILAIIFFSQIPASSVHHTILFLFNIAFIVITTILVGVHIGYQIRKHEFKKNFPE